MNESAPFLRDGGQMGARMRAHDWSRSPLGPPETWSRSLGSVVGLMLGSKFPMFLAWGPELGFLYNDSYSPILGTKHPDALGRPFEEIWSEIWSGILPFIETALVGQASWVENLPLVMNRHGYDEEAFFTFSYSPAFDDGGQVVGLFCACTETTAQVLAERRQAFRLALEERLRDIADPDAVMTAAVAMLGRHLGVERVGYGHVQSDDATVRLSHCHANGVAPLSGDYPLESFGAETIARQRRGETVVRDDVLADPGPDASAWRAIDTRSMVSVPLVRDGHLRATLYVNARKPRRWSADEIALVEDVAIRTWDAVERARAEADLRESEDNYRHTVELNPQTTWTATPDGQLDRVADRWREWTGGSGLGASWGEAMHPDDLDRSTATWMRSVTTGEPYDIEHRARMVSGAYRWMHSRAFPRRDADGRIVRWYGSTEDIHERKQAEEALRELNETLERRVEEQTQERDRIWHLSRDMLGVADAGGVWLSVNPAWSRILGWPAEQIVGQTSQWLEHPGSRGARLAAAPADGERAFQFESRFRTQGGEHRTLHWTTVQENGLSYCVARDVTVERERAASLRLFANIVESASAPICAFDSDYRLIAFNKAHSDEFFRIYGHRVRIGDVFPDLFLPEQAPVIRGFMARALTGERFTVTEEFGDPKLEKPCWEVSYSPIRDEDERILGAFHYAQDISARLKAQADLASAQEALRQSQKMEAVGQLTGGLAHDFNNLLAGISGSLELMQARLAQGRVADVDKYLVGAQGAAKRAAALTHRLLAFSRRQTLDPRATDVNRLVRDMEELLSRTVGPSIQVETVAGGGLWSTLVDPNQLENALLNLCINARDAMPDGGRLTIETGNRWLDERAARERDLPPGQYVSMCVSDNGTGMTAEVIERAFDPFFTTKPIGVGTGLGLSMIYGFARQSGGQVRIYSEVGQGTMVCLYLPRHHAVAEIEAQASAPGTAPRARAGETVLVIDDEPLVRMLVVDVLEELGYTALEAGDGPQGMAILRSGARLDLLITDVGLPNGMNGRQVADAARQIRPDLGVLFITGYAENAVLSHGHLDPGMQVVTKPFDMIQLANRIRSMVER